MRRRRVSLATPSSHERRRQLMNDYQHKSRQTVKMSLNKCGFELLVANLTFCIMSKWYVSTSHGPDDYKRSQNSLQSAWPGSRPKRGAGNFLTPILPPLHPKGTPWTPSLRHKRSLNACAATCWTILYCFYSHYFGRSLAPKSRLLPSFSNVAIISWQRSLFR